MLQELMFPEGISYDWENNEFRTERVNILFMPIPYLCKGLDKNKNRIDSNKLYQSDLVSHTGFEPVTPTLSR